MRSFIAILTLTTIIIGCQPAAPEGKLAELQQERTAVKASYDSLGKVLRDIDDKIAALDTTKKPPMVTTYNVTSAPFDHYFYVQGDIKSDYNTMVYPEINGIVKRILVEEGQRVGKGQSLIELDTEVIAKNIREVETNYALAEELYVRQKNLWEQNIGSEVQYLEAKTRKESLENTLATLNAQMDMGIVRSPFAGIVDEITPNLGEMASPVMPVARVLNLDVVYVEADVSEYYFGKVDEGFKVQVEIPDVDTIATEVSRVGKYINPENRTFNMRVDLDNKENDLIPNLVATLKVNDFHSDTAISLPSSMIFEDTRGKEFVFVIDESGDVAKVKKTIIQTGMTSEGMTMIISGLKDDMVIVDKGARKITDGSLVRIEENGSNQIATR